MQQIPLVNQEDEMHKQLEHSKKTLRGEVLKESILKDSKDILLRHEVKEISPDIMIKKMRACSYYSPFRNICVHPDHSEYDDCYPNRHPRCHYRGKYPDCHLVDKIIELTLDENNTIMNREYLYIKGRVDINKLEESLRKEIEDNGS